MRSRHSFHSRRPKSRLMATLSGGAALIALASTNTAMARDFNIPAKSLNEALIEYSLQAEVSVLVSDSHVRGLQSNAVAGDMETLDALKTLLHGTGLDFEFVDDSTISIHPERVESGALSDRRRVYAQNNQRSDANLLQPETAPPSVIEQIVVTARRRAESQLDVPVSITSFSGPKLERLGTVDVTSLNDLVPNVTFEVSRNTNTTLTPFIRGVGQQDPVAGFEQGVGVYIDDVYLNRPQGAVLDVYDVERIEVLRGPQGTLYGRNTIGGAIKYVTRKLADRPTLKLQVAGGSFRQIDAVGSFSLPVSDEFRMGGTIATFQRDGFGDNLTLGIENGSKDILAGRLSFEWTPTPDLFIRVAGDWTDDNSDPQQGHRLTPGQLSGAPVLDNVFDTRAGLNTPEANVVNRGISGLIEWTLTENITLKNIIAYRDNKSTLPEDFDSLPAADLDVPVRFNDDQFTEELQILYESPRLNGVAGFFYMNANAFNEFDVILETTGDIIGLPGLNAFTLGDVETDTWSVFGDFTYEIFEGWELSAGGRFTSDERSANIVRSTFLGGFSPAFGGPERDPIAVATDFTGSETFEDFNAKASLSWKPTEGQNIYFTFSQGFKGGGFDPRGSATAAPDLDGDGVAGPADPDDVKEFLQFQPETVDSFEFGHKGRFFNGRLNTSVALFWMDYEDIQIPGSVGVDTDGDGVEDTFTGVTSNAGEGRIRGIEFEGQGVLADNLWSDGDSLTAEWGVGFLDTKFLEFIDAFGQDIADQAQFQNAPEWTANASLTYTTPLGLFNTDGALSIIPQASYRGDTNQFEVNSAGLDQEAYVLFNFNMIWTSSDDRWEVSFHGRNLTDKEYIVSGFDFVNDQTGAPELGLEGTLTAFFGPPRTFTGKLTYKF